MGNRKSKAVVVKFKDETYETYINTYVLNHASDEIIAFIIIARHLNYFNGKINDNNLRFWLDKNFKIRANDVYKIIAKTLNRIVNEIVSGKSGEKIKLEINCTLDYMYFQSGKNIRYEELKYNVSL